MEKHSPRFGTVALCALLLVMTSCTSEEPISTEADEEAIQTVADNWAAALSNGDMDGVFALWTEDGVELPPGPARIGRASIRDRFEEVTTGGSVAASISFDEVEVAGDWAFARGIFEGTWTPEDGSAQTQETNHNLWVMRRQSDGTWRIARMMWHATEPPGSP